MRIRSGHHVICMIITLSSGSGTEVKSCFFFSDSVNRLFRSGIQIAENCVVIAVRVIHKDSHVFHEIKKKEH